MPRAQGLAAAGRAGRSAARGADHTIPQKRGSRGRWLLACALACACLSAVLARELPPSFFPVALGPGVVALLMWLVSITMGRNRVKRPVPTAWALAAMVFVASLAIGTVVSMAPNASAPWSVQCALVLVVVPWAMRSLPRSRQDATATVVEIVGTVVALGSLFERLREQSPFGLVTSQSVVSSQWATYRSQFGFGHPLVDGAFLATICAFSFHRYLASESRNKWHTLVFLSAALGVASTASRSAIVALAVGLVAPIIVRSASRATRSRQVLWLTGAAIAGWLIVSSPLVADRLKSREAAVSADYRVEDAYFAWHLFTQDPFGVGPALSEMAARSAGSLTPVENSFLGALVSLGAIGAAAMMLVLLIPMLEGRSGGANQIAGAAGLLTALVSAAGFALWETDPNFLLLIGLMMGVAWSTSEPSDTESSSKAEQVYDRPARGIA